jgi:hypothetical protein
MLEAERILTERGIPYRLIELTDRAGCAASETPDFDPTGLPADLVVELWEIRKRA